ncbi:MAG: VWA-like domain-containing protein [Thiohalocapsa sp.]
MIELASADDSAAPKRRAENRGHRGTRAIQKMVEFAPSTGGLALWVHHRDVDAEDAPAIAANDGATIYYGPQFETLSLPVQVGLVAHQVLHVALRHAQRRDALARLVGDVDPQLYNICADAIVNSTLSHLSWLELPAGSVLLQDLLSASLNIRQGVEKSLLEWDLERLYRAVDDRKWSGSFDGKRNGAGDQRNSKAGDAGGSDPGAGPEQTADPERPASDGQCAARARYLAERIISDLLPAADSDQPEAEAEQSREWRERIVRAHAGDGVHSILRELLADLPKVRTPWEQLLRTQLARGLSHQPDLSWSRPSRSYLANQGRAAGSGRRMPWEPGVSTAKAVARLAVLVDVSGSIDEALLARFAGEIESITRRLEAGAVVIIGDDQVTGVELFEPGRSNLRDIHFHGGGGTDFAPLLREAERHGPDIAVFLTDLDGPANYRPGFPVLWCVPIAHAAMPHPFGRKLVLD